MGDFTEGVKVYVFLGLAVIGVLLVAILLNDVSSQSAEWNTVAQGLAGVSLMISAIGAILYLIKR